MAHSGIASSLFNPYYLRPFSQVAGIAQNFCETRYLQLAWPEQGHATAGLPPLQAQAPALAWCPKRTLREKRFCTHVLARAQAAAQSIEDAEELDSDDELFDNGMHVAALLALWHWQLLQRCRSSARIT